MIKLGDLVEKALSSVGITSERVSSFLGRECGCAERKRRLNQLSEWASRVLSGSTEDTEDAEKHLDSIVSQPDPVQPPCDDIRMRRRRP